MVDLAAMRDAVAKHGVDPSLVNPKCPTDLVVDHSLQIDYSKWLVHGFIFSFNKTMFIPVLMLYSAIQNTPNPGGGVGPNHSQHPSRAAPSRPLSRGFQCGGQRSCSKAACSDLPASSGQPGGSVQQIENTPLLCPFHLQPVSEWVSDIVDINSFCLISLYHLQTPVFLLIHVSCCCFLFFWRTETALKNQEMELSRNKERLQFFKVKCGEESTWKK